MGMTFTRWSVIFKVIATEIFLIRNDLETLEVSGSVTKMLWEPLYLPNVLLPYVTFPKHFASNVFSNFMPSEIASESILFKKIYVL